MAAGPGGLEKSGYDLGPLTGQAGLWVIPFENPCLLTGSGFLSLSRAPGEY